MIFDGFAPFLQDFATFFFAGLEYVFLDTFTHIPDVEQVQGVLAAGTYPLGNSLVAVADKYRDAQSCLVNEAKASLSTILLRRIAATTLV